MSPVRAFCRVCPGHYGCTKSHLIEAEGHGVRVSSGPVTGATFTGATVERPAAESR